MITRLPGAIIDGGQSLQITGKRLLVRPALFNIGLSADDDDGGIS
jgi:hypothetical protein